jgi:hypothetical protein
MAQAKSQQANASKKTTRPQYTKPWGTKRAVCSKNIAVLKCGSQGE